MRCQVVLLLLAVTGLAGCSFLPLYSYNNQENDLALIPVPRPVENIEPHEPPNLRVRSQFPLIFAEPVIQVCAACALTASVG